LGTGFELREGQAVQVLGRRRGRAHVRWDDGVVRHDGWVDEAAARLARNDEGALGTLVASDFGSFSDEGSHVLRAGAVVRDAPRGQPIWTAPRFWRVDVVATERGALAIRIDGADDDIASFTAWADADDVTPVAPGVP
jgi:hypothetical protein